MRLMKLSLLLACAAALIAVIAPALAQESGGDHSEAEHCAECHFPGMAIIVGQWESSEHAKSYDDGNGATTYCAECKAPLNWNPDDPYPGVEVPWEEWQDIMCTSCHGLLEDLHGNDLCLYCHTGPRHLVEFQGFGKVMFEKKDVGCMDCHMPEVPNVFEDGTVWWAASHEWTVEDNMPWSCGTGMEGCHPNKTAAWGLKQINKAKIHGKK